ncbi:MAG: hypothetical protein R6V31_05245 [Halohasta sp.]
MTRNTEGGTTTPAGVDPQCGAFRHGTDDARTAPTDSGQSTNQRTMVTTDAC